MPLRSLLVAVAASACPLSAQLLASESFQYPPFSALTGQNGGAGFAGAWIGPTGTSVRAPGFDGLGGLARVSGADFRLFTNPAEFFKDGTSLWISFSMRRAASNTTGAWGGVALFDGSTTNERLFLGQVCCGQGYGFHSYTGGGARAVPGSTALLNTTTHIVTRLDFSPGPDFLSLWMNPPADHPTTPPDLVQQLGDVTFDRVRLASDGLAEFDGIRFERHTMFADVNEVSASRGGRQNLQIDAGAGQANRLYVVLGSITGYAPGLTQAGVFVPLNVDVYTYLLLGNLGSFGTNLLGVTGPTGQATATVQFAPGFIPLSLVGLELNHAAVLLQGNTAAGASNPVRLALVN